jgi:hypothetical protein
MNKVLLSSLAVTTILAAACSESSSAPASNLAISMASVYNSTPAGFSSLTSSYDATGDVGAFAPMFDHDGGRGPGGPGFGGPGFGLGLMGGGLDGSFFGDGLGPTHIGFFLDRNCAFTAGTGVVCSDTTRDGLISKKTIQYKNAAGTLQSKMDSTTASVGVTASVTGTATRRDSSTSTVNESSTQNVTGLLGASRTVNGNSSGTETTNGKSSQGTFTAKRTTTDVINGVVIPKSTSSDRFPYPTAGTITRTMNATVTITGQAATSTSRSETITYDGSATAKVVIVKDGVTQNCTLPLPHGRLACS